MIDGLETSGIGLGAAFGVLVALMLCTAIVTRVLGKNGRFADVPAPVGAPHEANDAAFVAETKDLTIPAAPAEADAAGLAETAAVAAALAAHLRAAGKELSGRRMRIDGSSYEVVVGDHSLPSIPIALNGQRFLASLGAGLRTEGARPPASVHGLRSRHTSNWRSAVPVPLGGCWERRGWVRGR